MSSSGELRSRIDIADAISSCDHAIVQARLQELARDASERSNSVLREAEDTLKKARRDAEHIRSMAYMDAEDIVDAARKETSRMPWAYGVMVSSGMKKDWNKK